MLHKIISVDLTDIESGQLEKSDQKKGCRRWFFIELLKPPTESLVSGFFFFCNSIAVLVLSIKSKNEEGPTATGAKVKCNLIPISMTYFVCVGRFVTYPKLMAYGLDSKQYLDDANHSYLYT